MKLDFSGKNTLVIGGARGIGAEIIRECAAAGSNVAWSCRTLGAEDGPSAQLLREVRAMGVDAFAMESDSTDEKAAEMLFAEVEKRWNNLDNLVYNTGFTSPVNFADISYTEWKRVVDINLNGAFLAVSKAIPLMLRNGGGSIVIIGSAAIATGGGGRVDYVSAKAGLEGLSKAITKSYSPSGIRCNIVHPSLIETDLLVQRYPDAEKRSAIACEIPLRRLGKPEDIAAATVFLLSDAASYITAQSLYVDGGRTFCK